MPPTAANEVEEAPAKIRDVRIDDLGFVNELWDHFDKKIKPQVKANLVGKQAERGGGDFFDALQTPSSYSEIDPAKFLKRYEEGKCSRKEFLSAIKVSNKPALAFMSQKEIDAISTTSPGTDRLVVSRIKSVEFTLVDAVRAISKSIGE